MALLLASMRVEPALLRAFMESRAMFDLLRDTPLGQQLLQEAEQRGEQRVQEAELRGRQQGEQQGEQRCEQRGRVEGLYQALARALTHRFGNLPDTLLSTLQGINEPERLEQLLDAVLDAPDLKSFQAQL